MGRERDRSRPFQFRGCDLTAECLPATEDVRAQLPAAAPNSTGRAPARAAESPKLSLPGAAPGRLANFHFPGSWQTSNAPALQAGSCGRDTHRLHQPSPATSERAKAAAPKRSAGGPDRTAPRGLRLGKPLLYRGENEIQASLICSASVGATPTPATNSQGGVPAAGL
jgi:hypothetical protein